MTLSEIIDSLTRLSSAPSPATFVYDFLACFDTPKSTLARLRSGGLNLAKTADCTLLKGKLYFAPAVGGTNGLTPEKLVHEARATRYIAAAKPRFFVATDFQKLVAFDAKTSDSLTCSIQDLHESYAFFLPLAGMERTVFPAETEADVRAAEHMAKLYDLIRVDNPPKTQDQRHALNVFLTRLLFCYFAEDTGIFADQLFTHAIDRFTHADGSDVSSLLAELFLVMNTPQTQRKKIKAHLADFPYVNGGLFSDTPATASTIPKFSKRSRQKLIELGNKSWKEINPDIFGSMFQGVVDDEMRAELGMHYTSVPNILKVIRPLFLDDLYEEFSKTKSSTVGLRKLLARIYRLRLFDPACGSGNFLIIAYKELRRLEMAVYKELRNLTGQLPFPFSGILVSQFFGIELDDFAHEVAILALWLSEHQMNLEFQAAFASASSSLPLKAGANIVCGDATRLSWDAICPKDDDHEVFVMGNPPYCGARNQSDEQKNDVEKCFDGAPEHKDADFISCWFLKGAAYLTKGRAALAFVTTNSVCQGDHVAILWPRILDRNVEISFAYTSFKWTNSAKQNAAVTCAIVGLRPTGNAPKWIFGNNLKTSARNINPYLADAPNTIIGRRAMPLSKGFPTCVMGSMPRDGGNLILEREDKDQILAAHPEAEPLIRKLVGAQEFVRSETRWCLWIADSQLELARSIPPIARRIENVLAFRKASTAHTTNGYSSIPHQFAQRAHKDGSSIFVPSATSERRSYIPMGYLDASTVISNLAQAIYNAELWIFAVVSSRMHMVWVRAVAGRLKTDYRYSSSICYNNFPFPEITRTQKERLEKSAELVLVTREKHPGKTIAWLYDPDTMPADLRAAHRDLDDVVEKCYRPKSFASDDERLQFLFTQYEQMASATQHVATTEENRA